MAAVQKLWPDPPRLRRLHPREEVVAGQRVWVDGDETPPANVWRFDHWMGCGRDRFALLRCGDPSCRDLHVCGAQRVMVEA